MTDKRVTQVAVEQWVRGPAPAAWVTQASIEHWATVAYYLPGAMHADGQAQVAFTGRLVKPGAAHMDGHAQVSFAGARLRPGAAHMDGQAQAVFSRIAVTNSAAHMDGRAQMQAAGTTRVSATARMDGTSSMIAPRPIGAGVAYMDGTSSMVVTNSMAGPQTYPVVLSEQFTGTDQVTKISHAMWARISHIINMRESLPASARYKKALQDSIKPADRLGWKSVQRLLEAIILHTSTATHTHYAYTLVQSINLRPTTPVPLWNAIINLVQGISISSTTNAKFIWGRILKEIFKVSAAVGATGVYKKSLAQLFKFAEVFALKRNLILNEHISLSSSSFLAVSMKLLQKLLAASTVSPKLNYHLRLLAEIVIGDIPGHYHFAAMMLAELFTIQPNLSRQFIADQSLAQVLTVHPALNNKLVLKIVGNIQLSPEQLVKMIFTGDALFDGVAITALYVSPSGTTTTWAVNTRTNAVTEYLNYDFRSFALMGNRYIAAGADGLYELEGDTDDGALIISELMSGYLQLNDKKLFGIKGAYVAIRGGGRFYLKLISGDGREYVYELKAQPNLMTTKVRVGKGISTSYVAFDLVTEGQDFDLDSIEFIPMTRGRRV